MIRDIFRMMFAEMFASSGFDHEIMLQRLQITVALIGSNPIF